MTEAFRGVTDEPSFLHRLLLYPEWLLRLWDLDLVERAPLFIDLVVCALLDKFALLLRELCLLI